MFPFDPSTSKTFKKKGGGGGGTSQTVLSHTLAFRPNAGPAA